MNGVGVAPSPGGSLRGGSSASQPVVALGHKKTRRLWRDAGFFLHILYCGVLYGGAFHCEAPHNF